MTNEEHIEQLKKLRSFHNGSYGRSINKAIEALEQEPSREIEDYENEIEDLHNRLDIAEYDKERLREEVTNLEEKIKALEQDPKPDWIPVSERLPEPFSFVNCTCHSLIDDREDWVVETCYLPQPHNSPYSDWGNLPMLNWGEAEVIAWMYRDIPKPYKAESEE